MRTRLAVLAVLTLTLAACGDADGGGGSDGASFAITTSALPAATVGVPYSAQIQTSGGTGTVTFAWQDGFVAPVWLTLGADGSLSGTPLGAGPIQLQVEASDSAASPRIAQRSLALTVQPAPAITSTSVPRAILGQPYSAQLAFQGVGTSVQTSSALPAGISLTVAGLLSGAPTESGLFELTIEQVQNSNVVDARQFDLMVYESIPFTYVEDALENNDTTGTATQLFSGNTPAGRMTAADRHVQSVPLTLNSDQNLAKPDPSDFFSFNIGNVGTIKIEVFFRALVGRVDISLWRYAGPPTHAVSVVANVQGNTADDATLVYHNAQLSGTFPSGHYYLQVSAPGDPVRALWNRNAYSFRVSFSDLTIPVSQVDADSAAGALNVPLPLLNQGTPESSAQWSLLSGSLPSGVSFTSDGRFTGTPTEFGLRAFHLRADIAGQSVERVVKVRFFDSAFGDYWQVKGERRIYNGTTNPVFDAYGDAMVVAPHPQYPTGAIYVVGGRTTGGANLNSVRVFHTDAGTVDVTRQFKFEDINQPMSIERWYTGAAFVQHSYGGFIYAVGGETGSASAHVPGGFVRLVERLQVSDGSGAPLPHPLAGWQAVAELPGTEGALAIQGWAEFGLVAHDAGADADDRLFLIAGRYQIEDSIGSGTFSAKFHDALLMFECPLDAVSQGTWHRKTDIAPYQPVRFPGVAMVDGRIFVIAGRAGTLGQTGSGGLPNGSIQMYQPSLAGTNPAIATAGPASFPSLNVGVYYPMTAVLGGIVYLWGGWDLNVAGTSALYRFTPGVGGTGGALSGLADADWGFGFGGGVAHEGKLWLISGIGHGVESLPVNLCYTP